MLDVAGLKTSNVAQQTVPKVCPDIALELYQLKYGSNSFWTNLLSNSYHTLDLLMLNEHGWGSLDWACALATLHLLFREQMSFLLTQDHFLRRSWSFSSKKRVLALPPRFVKDYSTKLRGRAQNYSPSLRLELWLSKLDAIWKMVFSLSCHKLYCHL